MTAANGAVSKRRIGAPQFGRKQGFCPANLHIAGWEYFIQKPFIASAPTCVDPDQPQMTLTSGWGDAYEWQRVQQYVPFPVNAGGRPQEGFYLLRTTVNRDGALKETDGNDNSSYAYFEVCSRADCQPQGLRLIARGYGPEP